MSSTQSILNLNNGRVGDTTDSKALNTKLYSYKLFEDTNISKNNYRSSSLSHEISPDQLSELFFSQANIDALQEGIRYLVWKKTDQKHVISKQDETELKVVMRGIFVQYSKNLPFYIIGQVKDLNKKILDWVVPKIIVELTQYVNYTNDISRLPTPLEHPSNMSSAGTKFLYMKEF